MIKQQECFQTIYRPSVLASCVTAAILGYSNTALSEVENEPVMLEEVFVTATKRPQTLQEVPVAVSVVDSDTIVKSEIQDLVDIQSLVPSLIVVQRSAASETNFFIRGFGNGATNAGIEPSVGVFIDGVYRSRSVAQISDLPNLERIEVLRGPQSTLFGKNASAGVVSVITRAPQFERSGSLTASYGNYDAVRIKADITGPISDTLAYSFSANMNEREGYIDDPSRGEELNDRSRWGIRGQLLFEPSDELSVRVIADHDRVNESCCGVASLVGGSPSVINLLGGMVDLEQPFAYTTSVNDDPVNDIENSGVSLHLNYDLDVAELTSITAFRTHDSVIYADADFSAAPISQTIATTGIDTFTQEIRLTSSGDGKLDWMVGAFYFDESLDRGADVISLEGARAFVDLASGGALNALEPTVFGVPTGTFFQNGEGTFIDYSLENQSWSLFGMLDYHLSDQLTASLGLNYTSDEKDAAASSLSTDAFSMIDLTALGVAVAGDPTAFAGFAPLQFLPPFLDYPNAVEDGKTDDEELTYTLRLAYDINDNINIYASYATGFKASSFNFTRNSRPLASDFIPGSPAVNPPPSPIRDAGLAIPNLTSGTRFASPEESEVIELGLKASYDSFSLNLAIFDQSIEDFQSNVNLGAGFAFSNAGEQATKGLEIEATLMPTDQLTLVFSGTFLDAEYEEFVDSPFGDLSGEEPFGIPDTSLSTSVSYDFELNGLDFFARADWQYSSEITLFDNPTAQAAIEEQGIPTDISVVNASFGFTTDADLNVTLWGRNIFEDEYIYAAFPEAFQPGVFVGYPNVPATYGLTIRQSF